MSSNRFLHTIEIRPERARYLFGSSRRLERFTLDANGDWKLCFDTGYCVTASLVSAWVLGGHLLALAWRIMPGPAADGPGVGWSWAAGSGAGAHRVNSWVFRRTVHHDSWRRLMVRVRLPAIPVAAGTEKKI